MPLMCAAGYVRVSTARQAEQGLSLGEQRASIVAKAAAEGWELVEVFEDAGISGRKDSRPGLTALLDSLGTVDRVIVAELSRLGRSARGLLELFERFEAAGVELVTIRGQQIDTSGAIGRMFRALLVAMAEFEAEQLGERVAANAAQRAQQGRHHGRAPYGYRAKGGILRPEEAAASIVKRIYREADAGRSQRDIARALNAEGIASQTGRNWSQPSVGKVLSNPTYRGAIVFNGAEYPGQHEPIIEAELWERVAADRAREVEDRQKSGPKPQPKGRHLFRRGMLRCGHCGGAMSPRTEPTSGRESYYCLTRLRQGADACPQTPIERSIIDAAAFRYFEEVGLDVEATRTAMRGAVDAQRAEVSASIQAAEHDLTAAVERLQRVRRDYQDGKLDAADWKEQRDQLTAEQTAAEAKLALLRGREESVEAATERVAEAEDELAPRLAELRAAIAGKITDAPDLPATRRALERLFEAFHVYRRDVSEGPPPGGWMPGERDARDRTREAIGEVEHFEANGWIIAPEPREEALEIPALVRPVYRREPLGAAGEQEDDGLTT